MKKRQDVRVWLSTRGVFQGQAVNSSCVTSVTSFHRCGDISMCRCTTIWDNLNHLHLQPFLSTRLGGNGRHPEHGFSAKPSWTRGKQRSGQALRRLPGTTRQRGCRMLWRRNAVLGQHRGETTANQRRRQLPAGRATQSLREADSATDMGCRLPAPGG